MCKTVGMILQEMQEIGFAIQPYQLQTKEFGLQQDIAAQSHVFTFTHFGLQAVSLVTGYVSCREVKTLHDSQFALLLATTFTIEEVGIVHFWVIQIIPGFYFQDISLQGLTGSLQTTIVLLNLSQYRGDGIGRGSLCHDTCSCTQEDEGENLFLHIHYYILVIFIG